MKKVLLFRAHIFFRLFFAFCRGKDSYLFCFIFESPCFGQSTFNGKIGIKDRRGRGKVRGVSASREVLFLSAPRGGGETEFGIKNEGNYYWMFNCSQAMLTWITMGTFTHMGHFFRSKMEVWHFEGFIFTSACCSLTSLSRTHTHIILLT